VLQPVFAGFSILSPSWLWVVMPALFAAVAVFAWLASGRRLLRVRRVPAWRSASVGVSGPASYTAFGFANPTRRVLAAVLHTKAEVTRFDNGAQAAHVGFSSDVIEVVEAYLYRPLRRPFQLLVRAAQRLQSGRLDAYLAYMLIALIAVLAVVTGLR
jgi:hydrogenase-4 component B